jgi:hypothetical protein
MIGSTSNIQVDEKKGLQNFSGKYCAHLEYQGTKLIWDERAIGYLLQV